LTFIIDARHESQDPRPERRERRCRESPTERARADCSNSHRGSRGRCRQPPPWDWSQGSHRARPNGPTPTPTPTRFRACRKSQAHSAFSFPLGARTSRHATNRIVAQGLKRLEIEFAFLAFVFVRWHRCFPSRRVLKILWLDCSPSPRMNERSDSCRPFIDMLCLTCDPPVEGGVKCRRKCARMRDL